MGFSLLKIEEEKKEVTKWFFFFGKEWVQCSCALDQCQRDDGKTSSAAGALAATPVQPRLQRSAADSAPKQHKHASEQARLPDDTTASARVTNMKIGGLNDCQRTESCVTQLKKIKDSTNVSKRQSRGVAQLELY